MQPGLPKAPLSAGLQQQVLERGSDGLGVVTLLSARGVDLVLLAGQVTDQPQRYFFLSRNHFLVPSSSWRLSILPSVLSTEVAV